MSDRQTQFQASIGFSLPEDFLEFLTKHISRDEPGAYISSNPDYWALRSIFELGKGPKDRQIDEVYRLTHDVLPPRTIAVGEDWSGNLYLLSCSTDSYGQVLWWNHERDSGDHQTTLVADSFTSFLGLIAYELAP